MIDKSRQLQTTKKSCRHFHENSAFSKNVYSAMSRLCWCDEAITTERWITRKSSSYHRTIVILSSHCRIIVSSSSRHRAINVIAPSTKILRMRWCNIELCDPIQILSSWVYRLQTLQKN